MLLCILVENDDIDKMIHIIEMETNSWSREERSAVKRITFTLKVHIMHLFRFILVAPVSLRPPPPHKQPSLP